MDPHLKEEGLSATYQLADQSTLDEACDVVTELNAGPRALKDRHLDVPVIRNLFFDRKLQSVVAENFGADLFLWRSNFFAKGDGYPQISWHHDRHFEDGDAPIDIYNIDNHFSILIALTDIHRDTGGIEYIKGTHQLVPGFDRDLPRHIVDTPEAVKDRVTPLPLKRGEFVVFYSSLLHRSLAFAEGEPRISMVGRLARQGTRFPEVGVRNPVGGAQAEAEPLAKYEESRKIPFN